MELDTEEELGRYGDLNSPARRIAERLVGDVIEAAKSNLSRELKNITDELYSQINDATINFLASDSEMNFIDLVRDRSNRIIDEMLNGNDKLVSEYCLSWDTEKFRENIYKKYQADIHNKLIDDLAKERDQYREQCKWYRERDC